MRATAAAIVLLAACHGSTAPAISNVGAGTSIADAEAFERGAGVARDYTAAANIYADLCHDGDGDAAACRRLMRAIGLARGVDADRMRVMRLAEALCDKHGDRLGCDLAAFAAEMRAHPEHGTADPALVAKADALAAKTKAPRVCDRDHLDVCEAGLDFGLGDQSTSHAEAEHQFEVAACDVGVIDECAELVQEYSMCADEDRSDQGGIAKCTADMEQAMRSKDGDHDSLDALTRLRAACDAGDADGCAALPGHEIPYAQLCAAHDWGACAAMGCLGDAAAEKLGKAHGADANCYPIRNQAAARGADQDAGIAP